MKRIVLFLVTNLAVDARAVDRAEAVRPRPAMTSQTGISYGGLLAFSAVVGFTGAIISLLMSKQMAKWSTGAHVIEQPANEAEAWLVETVRRLATEGRHRHAGGRDLRGRRPTRSPPARSRTRRWSRSRPACCSR